MKRKFIIHAGMSKTGSSSIQAALKLSTNILKKNHKKYLGLMFEEVDGEKHPWQTPHGWQKFKTGNKEEVNQQLTNILLRLHKETKKDIDTFIWSNEGIISDIGYFYDAICNVSDYYDFQVVAYIRGPDTWGLSAYLQWGIKHKCYEGPVKSFRQWAQERKYRFGRKMQKCMEQYHDVKFYNFDSIDDITSHFFRVVLGIDDSGIDYPKVNTTVSPALLSLWAYYNSWNDGEVRAAEFARILSNSGMLDKPVPVIDFNDLMPGKKDMDNYVKQSAKELILVNQILKSMGQEEIKLSQKPLEEFSVNQEQLNLVLIKIIGSLYDRIETLEKITFKNPLAKD